MHGRGRDKKISLNLVRTTTPPNIYDGEHCNNVTEKTRNVYFFKFPPVFNLGRWFPQIILYHIIYIEG